VLVYIRGGMTPQLNRKRVKCMPQARAKKPIKSTEDYSKPVADVHSLISQILEYEDTAKEHNIDFTASRFRMLTATERDFLRAELVADFIRLSVGNTGKTPVYFDTSLFSFCTKISELQLASSEITGTYLAAMEVAREDKLSDKIKDFEELLKKTMVTVLQTCVEMLANKTRTSVLVPKKRVRKTAAA
jgi:hypothetical protein